VHCSSMENWSFCTHAPNEPVSHSSVLQNTQPVALPFVRICFAIVAVRFKSQFFVAMMMMMERAVASGRPTRGT